MQNEYKIKGAFLKIWKTWGGCPPLGYTWVHPCQYTRGVFKLGVDAIGGLT